MRHLVANPFLPFVATCRLGPSRLPNIFLGSKGSRRPLHGSMLWNLYFLWVIWTCLQRAYEQLLLGGKIDSQKKRTWLGFDVLKSLQKITLEGLGRLFSVTIDCVNWQLLLLETCFVSWPLKARSWGPLGPEVDQNLCDLAVGQNRLQVWLPRVFHFSMTWIWYDDMATFSGTISYVFFQSQIWVFHSKTYSPAFFKSPLANLCGKMRGTKVDVLNGNPDTSWSPSNCPVLASKPLNRVGWTETRRNTTDSSEHPFFSCEIPSYNTKQVLNML